MRNHSSSFTVLSRCLLAAFLALPACSDDGASSGAGGAGGAGNGGANAGGSGTGGATPCTQASDCGGTDYCAFEDGECGSGTAGTCIARPTFCSDGLDTCFCDGTISDLGCAGLSGVDLDHTGAACTPPSATALKCGELICDGGTDDYCEFIPVEIGGPPNASCNFAPTGCDPAMCACLSQEIQSCIATCEDTANGPIVTCAGG